MLLLWMTQRLSLQAARDFITAQGGRVAPLSLSEEELNPALQDDLSLQVHPLEDMDRAYPVPYTFPDESGQSEFRFFEDGRQRTVQIGYIPYRSGDIDVLLPVHYFAVGAAILERTDRNLSVWQEPVMEEGIVVERSLVPNSSLILNFEAQGLRVVDADSKTPGADYYQLRRRSLEVAKNLRLAAETRLITQWRTSPAAGDAFLVVDGTLMNFRSEDNVERCVGVSKSFSSRYFSSSDHNRILQLPAFHRSWTFRFHEEEEDLRLGGRERVSWYLRLRQSQNSDPEFGLIRAEISRKHMNQAGFLADRFSKSLLSDRLPTAYPRPRWDKLLYPIQACEHYLSSLMPSTETIRAAMRA
jgi:hypothetical protein